MRAQFLKLILIPVAVASFALTGCQESETTDLGKAQQCLDHVNESDSAAVLACMDPIKKYSSSKANALKCSISYIAAGLTSTKVTTAFVTIGSTGSADREAAMMTALALSDASAVSTADAYCKASGIESLIYLSSLTVIGTMIETTVGAVDPSDPNSVQNALNTCKASGCNNEQVGTAVIALSESYCTGDNATTELCQEIVQANAQGTSPADIGDQLFDLLDK